MLFADFPLKRLVTVLLARISVSSSWSSSTGVSADGSSISTTSTGSLLPIGPASPPIPNDPATPVVPPVPKAPPTAKVPPVPKRAAAYAGEAAGFRAAAGAAARTDWAGSGSRAAAPATCRRLEEGVGRSRRGAGSRGPGSFSQLKAPNSLTCTNPCETGANHAVAEEATVGFDVAADARARELGSIRDVLRRQPRALEALDQLVTETFRQLTRVVLREVVAALGVLARAVDDERHCVGIVREEAVECDQEVLPARFPCRQGTFSFQSARAEPRRPGTG